MLKFFSGVIISFVFMLCYGVAIKYGYVEGKKDNPEFNECINQSKLGNVSLYDCAKLEFEQPVNK